MTNALHEFKTESVFAISNIDPFRSLVGNLELHCLHPISGYDTRS